MDREADVFGIGTHLQRQHRFAGADFDAPLSGVREVAFFPPMTGG